MREGHDADRQLVATLDSDRPEFAIEWRLDDTFWVKLTGKAGVKEVFAAEMGVGITR